ncbi:coiled-coil domain-containing protein 89 [Diretmus argenteus]
MVSAEKVNRPYEDDERQDRGDDDDDDDDESRGPDMDSAQKSLENLRCLTPEEKTETGLLRSRIDEQSSLICVLKQRADEEFLRCEALQKINAELEGQLADGQRELDLERNKSAKLERRFMELAANHEEMIVFKDEYKRQNAQFRLENKQLQSENETLFSHKLQEKEELVHKLTQEIKQLSENHTNKENEHNLFPTSDLKLQLQKAADDHTLKEIRMKESITNLTKEKDKFLRLSMERGKIIMEKQEEIQQCETKRKAEEIARGRAEDRFKQEAAAVDANLKVKDLQCALDESRMESETLKKDFEAYIEHSTNLLTQEKELNATLRHMIG